VKIVTGVILAGGEASRFDGRAKGLELVGGTRIVDRVAEALRLAVDDLLMVANVPGAEDWIPGLRTERDVRPGEGSLGGIHAALMHAGGPVLVVAWDMPFVSASLLTELRSVAEESGADVVIPSSDGSRRGVEPLCAYYGWKCLPAIEKRLDDGDRRIVGFFDDVEVVRLPLEKVAEHGDPALLFMNVNTPADLAAAEEHASTTHGGGDRTQERG
jgi:molybdopterin-guanine dinucleotide biosynthesis protein A